jgi:AraC-like DNA-binding protein
MIETIAILSPIFITLFWSLVFFISYSTENKPKFILGLFMLSAFILYLTHGVYYLGDHLIYFSVEPIYLFVNLSVYPLYYVYIRYLTIESKWTFHYLFYLLPAIIISLASFIFGLMLNNEERTFYFEEFLLHRNFNLFEAFSANWFKMVLFMSARIVFIIQVFYTLFKGVILILQHEEDILNTYSNKKIKLIIGVKHVNISLIVAACTSTVLAIIGRDPFIDNGALLMIPSVILTLVFFVIGYFGNQIVPVKVPDRCKTTDNSIFDQKTKRELKEKLLNLFNDKKVFKNPSLKLCEVSDSVASDCSNISRLINEEFKVNFCDFVNQYRISLAKSMILDDSNNKLSLSDIAREAGFSTEESLVRVFKEYEGMTPSKFKEVMTGLNGKESAFA